MGRIFASEIWEAYFREGLFLGGLHVLSEFYSISTIQAHKESDIYLLTLISVFFFFRCWFCSWRRLWHQISCIASTLCFCGSFPRY